MTDKKTDKTPLSDVRTCHWALTIFDEYEIQLAQGSKFPPWVKGIRGQIEIAPTTNRRHFQCYLWTSQQRFSAIKKLFPTANISVVRNIRDIKAYVHKSETAVPGTQIDTLPTTAYKTMNETLNHMFKVLFIDNSTKTWKECDNEPLQDGTTPYKDRSDYASAMYRNAVNLCLQEDEDNVHNFVSNAIKQAFLVAYPYYEDKYTEIRKEAAIERIQDEIDAYELAIGKGQS